MDQSPVYSYPDEVARKWKAERDEALELLERAYGTVRTYGMQTYSKSAHELADQIDEFVKRLNGEAP